LSSSTTPLSPNLPFLYRRYGIDRLPLPCRVSSLLTRLVFVYVLSAVASGNPLPPLCRRQRQVLHTLSTVIFLLLRIVLAVASSLSRPSSDAIIGRSQHLFSLPSLRYKCRSLLSVSQGVLFIANAHNVYRLLNVPVPDVRDVAYGYSSLAIIYGPALLSSSSRLRLSASSRWPSSTAHDSTPTQP